ncbi:TPA: hypothetical protein ACF6GW_004184, partial [Salmonella enterica]
FQRIVELVSRHDNAGKLYMCFKYFELQDKAPTPLTKQSIGPEIYAVFSHHIKSLLRYLNLRSPDCS